MLDPNLSTPTGALSPASVGAEVGPIAAEKWEVEEKTVYEQNDSWYLLGNSVNSCKKSDDELGLPWRVQHFSRSHGELIGLSNTREIFSLQMAPHFFLLNIS